MFGGADLSYIVTLPNKVLTMEEIRKVLASLKDRQVSKTYSNKRAFWPELLKGETMLERVKHHHKRNLSAWQRLIIFRLSCCCGLRSKEIRLLRMNDLDLWSKRPHIKIRSEATKSSRFGPGKPRAVPLWWDNATLEDLRDYEAFLKSRQGEHCPNPYLIFNTINATAEKPLFHTGIPKRWDTALMVLPEHRRLYLHCGRHSFCTHALIAGHTIREVQQAAGHRWITTTQIYLHCLETGRDLPDVFPEEEIDW